MPAAGGCKGLRAPCLIKVPDPDLEPAACNAEGGREGLRAPCLIKVPDPNLEPAASKADHHR
jgi:hypothetical protein